MSIENPVLASVKVDYERELVRSGITVGWMQQTVVGQDKNGNDVCKFVTTNIQAFIRGAEPQDVRLIEPGFTLEQYLVMTCSASNDVAILDRVTFGGDLYEVRAMLPATEAQSTIMKRVRLRMLNTPIPPGGG